MIENEPRRRQRTTVTDKEIALELRSWRVDRELFSAWLAIAGATKPNGRGQSLENGHQMRLFRDN